MAVAWWVNNDSGPCVYFTNKSEALKPGGKTKARKRLEKGQFTKSNIFHENPKKN